MVALDQDGGVQGGVQEFCHLLIRNVVAENEDLLWGRVSCFEVTQQTVVLLENCVVFEELILLLVPDNLACMS